jgi:hypothetical protein
MGGCTDTGDIQFIVGVSFLIYSIYLKSLLYVGTDSSVGWYLVADFYLEL